MDYKNNKQKVAIVGAGPAGCICAYFAEKYSDVILFDIAQPLRTLLYTGGGRCNLAYSEYDFKELSKFYPRGEKFLYSIFSRFSTADAVEFFNNIGVETYAQDDLRMFPVSNSAKDTREKFLAAIKYCKIKREKVIEIKKNCEKFDLKTENNLYDFDKVVISVGGHSGFELAKKLGHKIVAPKPALTGLKSKQSFKHIQGVSLKDIQAQIFYEDKKIALQNGDILFTHEGISGPLAYQISSICARFDYTRENPLIIKLNFLKNEIDFQGLLNSNSKKDIKNLLADFVPKSLSEYILDLCKIDLATKCFEINGQLRDKILENLKTFQIEIHSPAKEGEIVTSGGVCLDEIESKTMQSKIVSGLYFCGEVIDVDGFCGGFNLQNCWSTGFVAGENI